MFYVLKSISYIDYEYQWSKFRSKIIISRVYHTDDKIIFENFLIFANS